MARSAELRRLPCGVIRAITPDEAVRVRPLQSRCQVRSEPAWGARTDSQARSMSTQRLKNGVVKS